MGDFVYIVRGRLVRGVLVRKQSGTCEGKEVIGESFVYKGGWIDREGWGDENIDIPRMVELEVYITLFHDPGVFRGYINTLRCGDTKIEMYQCDGDGIHAKRVESGWYSTGRQTSEYDKFNTSSLS